LISAWVSFIIAVGGGPHNGQGSAAARVRGESLRYKENYNARETADLCARSAVGCNPLLYGWLLGKQMVNVKAPLPTPITLRFDSSYQQKLHQH